MSKISAVEKEVQNLVLQGMEKKDKLPVWVSGWVGSNDTIPVNHLTGNIYKGLNQYLTWVAMDRNYSHNQWLTFNQIVKKKGLTKVRTGKYYKFVDSKGNKVTTKILKPLDNGEKQKACPVEYWTLVIKLKDNNKYFTREQYDISIKSGEYKRDDFIIWWKLGRIHYVYNVEQTTLPLPKAEKPKQYEPNNIQDIANGIMKGYDKAPKFIVRKMNKGESPHYTPSRHEIVLPLVEQYQEKYNGTGHLHWFKTFGHEGGHSTGHKDILAREGVTDLGKWEGHAERYAKEELIAEISASMLMSWHGFNYAKTIENTQTYINGWYSRLKDEPSIITNALREGSRAFCTMMNIK